MRSETNSGSILCRPPLPELDICACLWYAQHTCPFGHFWTLDEEVHALSRLADAWPGRVEPIGSKLQSLSKFAEPEVDGFLDVLNTPDGQSQHWVPGACCSSPVQKIDTGVSSSNMSSHLHRNSSKQTYKIGATCNVCVLKTYVLLVLVEFATYIGSLLHVPQAA